MKPLLVASLLLCILAACTKGQPQASFDASTAPVAPPIAVANPGASPRHQLVGEWYRNSVTRKDLAGYDADELRLLRNEIFARHGYVFKSDELRNYFSKQPWYVPNPKFKPDQLSAEEKVNVEEISLCERAVPAIFEKPLRANQATVTSFFSKGRQWDDFGGTMSFNFRRDGRASFRVHSTGTICEGDGYTVSDDSVAFDCTWHDGGEEGHGHQDFSPVLVGPDLLVYVAPTFRTPAFWRVVMACPSDCYVRVINSIVEIIPGAADHNLFEAVEQRLKHSGVMDALYLRGTQAETPHVRSEVYWVETWTGDRLQGEKADPKATAQAVARLLEPVIGPTTVQKWPSAWDADVVVVVGSETTSP